VQWQRDLEVLAHALDGGARAARERQQFRDRQRRKSLDAAKQRREVAEIALHQSGAEDAVGRRTG
jgi:hypothetical protein